MKNVVIMIAIGIGTALMLSGCGESVIKCDNNDAKGLVMEIAKNEIINEKYGRFVTYQELKKQSAVNPEAKRTLETIEKEYSEASPTLTNIRTKNIDNKLGKSECAAEIHYSNGNKTNITYNLSKTSEGKLYAEVF